MARPDRLFRLLQAMRVLPAPVTAARLAEETEVSLRSLYRDIDSLRAAGARIEGERGYGYRLIEDYALPPQTFDRDEIEALALGLAEVKRMGDPALAKAATSVLAKVAATLPDDREQHLFHAVSQVYRPEARFAAGLARRGAGHPLHRQGRRRLGAHHPAIGHRLYRGDVDPVGLVLPPRGVSDVPVGWDQRVALDGSQLSPSARGAVAQLCCRTRGTSRPRPSR